MDTATIATTSSAPGDVGKTLPGRNDPLRLLTSEFDRFYAAIYRYLLHRLFDRELAEELTGETFYRAAASIKRIRGDAGQMQVWLLRTATNLANTHHRRDRLRSLLLGRVAKRSPTTPPEADSGCANEERLADVRAVLLALPARYQSVVALRYYTQMSYDEMAAILGCSTDAVRARLSRAIREMRERLGAQGRSTGSGKP